MCRPQRRHCLIVGFILFLPKLQSVHQNWESFPQVIPVQVLTCAFGDDEVGGGIGSKLGSDLFDGGLSLRRLPLFGVVRHEEVVEVGDVELGRECIVSVDLFAWDWGRGFVCCLQVDICC